jgi:hypothetical protein
MKTHFDNEGDWESLPSVGELIIDTYVPDTPGHDKDDRKDAHWCDREGTPDGRPDEKSQNTGRDYYLCWRMRELCDAIYGKQ